MAFGYGARAYDDDDDDNDNAWWNQTEDTSSTLSTQKTSNINASSTQKTSTSAINAPIYNHSNYRPNNTPKQISNPAYRNQLQIRNKYKKPRAQETQRTQRSQRSQFQTVEQQRSQRPQFQTVEQQQMYKEELKQKTNSHLDESLRTVYSTEDIAADTSQRLYYQRKQLENVDKMLHETDENLDRTEHTLNGMKSIWGGITNYFRKTPERQQYQKKNTNKRSINISNQMMHMESEKQKGKHEEKGNDIDDEFNDKLDELHKGVQRIKMMAENMNQELEDQEGLIGGIDDKMNKVDQRIHKQTNTIKRIR